MAHKNGGGEFFAGLVIGGLIGAALSLLLAPQSGEETRAQLREKGLDLQHTASESLADSRGKADYIIADARAKAEKILADARTKAEELQEQAKGKAGELQTKGKAALETQTVKIKEAAAKIGTRSDNNGEAEA